jgi:hypothetical protein
MIRFISMEYRPINQESEIYMWNFPF